MTLFLEKLSMKTIQFTSVLFTAFALFGCGPYPDAQMAEMDKLDEIRDAYYAAKGNDIAQDRACKSFDDHVASMNKIDEWVAEVSKVNSLLGDRWVELELDDYSFKMWPDQDSTWESTGIDLGLITVGEAYHFSGTVRREMSITCSGKMRNPEIVIEPSAMQRHF